MRTVSVNSQHAPHLMLKLWIIYSV